MDYYGFKIDEYKSICYNPHMPVENQILLNNIAAEGIDMGGFKYVNFIDVPSLSRPTLDSVAALCKQTEVGDYRNPAQAQANLSEGWIVKSLGTDNFKIIAVNPKLEGTGIMIKRYLKKE